MKQQANQVLGIDFLPQAFMIDTYEKGTFTPQADPFYLFDRERLKPVLMWYAGIVGRNLFIGGPTGSGKSSLPEQLAARTGKELFRVSCNGRLEMADLIGRFVLKANGTGGTQMDFHLGPLPTAMKTGAILLLDEGDTLHPSVALGLNGVLDGSPLLIPETGELIQPAEGFRIVVTGNTTGNGDETGNYRGTQRQNLAYLDRFMVMEVPYLDKLQEIDILNRSLQVLPEKKRIDPSKLEVMVQTADSIRSAFMRGELDATVSTRTLRRWAHLSCHLGGNIADAFNYALLNRCKEESKNACLGILKRFLPVLPA